MQVLVASADLDDVQGDYPEMEGILSVNKNHKRA